MASICYSNKIHLLTPVEQMKLTDAFLELPFSVDNYDSNDEFVSEIREIMQKRMSRDKKNRICHPFLVWKPDCSKTIRIRDLKEKYIKKLDIQTITKHACEFESVRDIFNRTMLYILIDAENTVDKDTLPIIDDETFSGIRDEDYEYTKDKLSSRIYEADPTNAITLVDFLEDEGVSIPTAWHNDPINHYSEIQFLYMASSNQESEKKTRRNLLKKSFVSKLYKIAFEMVKKGDVEKAYKLLNGNVAKIAGKEMEFEFIEYVKKLFGLKGDVSLDDIDISDIRVAGKKGQVKCHFHQILKENGSFSFNGEYTIWNNDFMVFVQLNPSLEESKYVFYVIPTSFLCDENGKVKKSIKPELLDKYMSDDYQAKFYISLFDIKAPSN